MQNEYKLIVYPSKEEKEEGKYKNELIQENFYIVSENEKAIFLKKNNENVDLQKENKIINLAVSMSKKYKFNNVKVINLTKDINKILEQVKDDDEINLKIDKHKICWRFRQIFLKALIDME